MADIDTPAGITYQSGGKCPRCATGQLAWVYGPGRLCLRCGFVVEPGEEPAPTEQDPPPARVEQWPGWFRRPPKEATYRHQE